MALFCLLHWEQNITPAPTRKDVFSLRASKAPLPTGKPGAGAPGRWGAAGAGQTGAPNAGPGEPGARGTRDFPRPGLRLRARPGSRPPSLALPAPTPPGWRRGDGAGRAPSTGKTRPRHRQGGGRCESPALPRARSRRSARGAGLLEGEPLTDLGHAGHEDPERDDVGVLDVVPFEGDHLEALARVLSVAGPLLDAQRPRHLTQRQQQRQRQSPAGARGPAPRHLRAAQRAVQTRMSWDSGCARGNALARAQPRTLGVQAAVPVPRPPGWPLIWRPPPALGRGLPAPAARTRAQTPPPPGTPSRV